MTLNQNYIDLLERFRVRGLHTPDELKIGSATPLWQQDVLFKQLKSLSEEGYLIRHQGQWSLTGRGQAALQAWALPNTTTQNPTQ